MQWRGREREREGVGEWALFRVVEVAVVALSVEDVFVKKFGCWTFRG